MKKQIQKVGNSQGIIIYKNEMGIYGLKIGDIIDIGDLVKVKRKK